MPQKISAFAAGMCFAAAFVSALEGSPWWAMFFAAQIAPSLYLARG